MSLFWPVYTCFGFCAYINLYCVLLMVDYYLNWAMSLWIPSRRTLRVTVYYVQLAVLYITAMGIAIWLKAYK